MTTARAGAGRLTVGLVLALSGALALSACSTPATEEESPTADAGGAFEGTVQVGMIPVGEFASAYVALDQGFFEEEGLDVEMQVIQNAASIAPSVLNGQLQFGTAASSPFLSAVGKGLPLVAVANGSSVPDTPEQDPFGVIVAPDSGIEDLTDLAGKTVAVNALGSGSHVTTVAAIAKAGADHTKTTFVAMPFPDMLAALERGTIDAAKVVEPFLVQGLEAGMVAIANPLTATLESGTYSLFFTSREFAEQHPDVVEKFRKAVDRASLAAAEDHSLVGDALAKHANLDPALFAKMRSPIYTDQLDVDALQTTADLMVEYGFLEEPLDVSQAVIQ